MDKRGGTAIFRCVLAANSRSLLLALDRQPGFEPRIESALKRSHIRETMLSKLQCQTGAGGLVRSSAIGDNRSIARDLRQVLFRFCDRDAQRTG